MKEVLPQVDLKDLLDNPSTRLRTVCIFTNTIRYACWYSTKNCKKIFGKATKTALAQKVAKSALATSTVGKGVSNVAKFGGYWALPIGISDATVSASGQETIGGIFGKSEEEGGNWLQQSMLATKPESLEGLDGKERAAAILRNKLKFGIEGASFMGALKLVGPTLKFGATGLGVINRNVTGPVLTGMSNVVGSKPVMKFMQGTDKFLNKSGIPDFKYWKFSEAKKSKHNG